MWVYGDMEGRGDRGVHGGGPVEFTTKYGQGPETFLKERKHSSKPNAVELVKARP